MEKEQARKHFRIILEDFFVIEKQMRNNIRTQQTDLTIKKFKDL